MLKVLAALGLAAVAVATPLWQPHLAHASIGRNIRHLPCVSRRSGESGTCMFAFSCAKANGTHLGTCIDRFYFGSCCRLPELEGPVDIDAVPPIEDNFLDGTTTARIRPAVTQKPSTPTTPAQHQPTLSTASTSKPTTVAPTLVTWTTVEESSGKPSVPASIRPQVSPSSAGTHRPVVGSTTQASPSSSRPPTVTSTPTYVSSVTPGSPSTQRPPPTHGPMSSPLVGVTTPQPTPSIAPVSSLRPPVSTHRPVSVVTLPSSSAAPSTQTTHGVSFQPVSTQRPPPPSSTGRPPSSSARPPPPSSARPPSSPSKPASPSSVRPTSSTSRPTSSTSRPPSSTSRPPANTSRPPANTSRPPPSSTRPQTATSRPTPSPPRPSSSPSRPPPTSSRPPSSSTRPPSGTSRPPQATQKPRPSSATTSKPKPTQRPTTKPGVKPKPTPKPKPPSKPIAPTKPTVTTARPTTRPTSTTTAAVTTNATTAIPSTSSTAQKPASETWVPVSVSTHAPSTALPTDKTPTSTTTKPQHPQESTTTSPVGISSTTTSSAPGNNASLPTTTTAGPSLTQHLNMTNYREVCGRRLFPESRVVGGDKSSFGKWPWQISLRQWRTSTYLHKCGAALLNENWAITAAHCVENVPPSDLLLRLGEHDLSVEDEPYGYQERRVQIVASHPQFDPRTFEYDLALLRFYEPVVFQPNIIPICVPEDNINFVGTTAYVTGWGRLYEDGPLPSVLQEVSVPVINNSLCETMYRAAGYIEHIPDIFICAGWKKGGFDSCEGDSGGPMVIQRPDRRWLLAGVISWGIGCAEPNQPGVYTRISQFRDWINQILQF